MKIIISILFILTISLFSCSSKDNQYEKPKKLNTEENLFSKYSNDTIKYKLFKIAIMNSSTAPNYIVFKAKDINSGIVKEICCESPFLEGALQREFKLKKTHKYQEFIDSIILANFNKVFEFRDKEALKNISFDNYPEYKEIIKIAKSMNLEYYHKKYGTNDTMDLKYFENDTGFVQLTFCHIMFNCGISTIRDCEAGNNIHFGISYEDSRDRILSLNPLDELIYDSDFTGDYAKFVNAYKEIKNVELKDFLGTYNSTFQPIDTLRIYDKKGEITAYHSSIDCDQQWKEKLKDFKINNNCFYAKDYIGKMVEIKNIEGKLMKGLLIAQKLGDGEVNRDFWRKIE